MRSRHFPLFLGAFMAASGPLAWSENRDDATADASRWCSPLPVPGSVVLDAAQADRARHVLALFSLHRSQTRTQDLHLIAYAGGKCLQRGEPASQRRAL